MTVDKSLYQAMIDAAGQTLENMAFMEVMQPGEQTDDLPAEDLVWTSLLIHDPVQGEVRLAMPSSLLKKLTGNVFAMPEEEVATEQMNDIINELLNTIAGLFMTNLLSDDQEYQLGLPELGTNDLPDSDADTVVWKLMTSDEDPFRIFAVGTSLLALKQD